jgi:hypothetical protein
MSYKHEAIYKLYSNVTHIVENLDDTFTALDITEQEVSINMDDVNAKATELQSEEQAKETQKETDKVNGNQKLLDLGLTQEEATALTGYKPEVTDGDN